MKKTGLFIILTLLMSCQVDNNNDSTNDNMLDNTDNEDSTESHHNVSIDKVKDIAFYETTLQTQSSTKNIYISHTEKPTDIEGYVIDGITFFVADPDSNEATIQTDISFKDEDTDTSMIDHNRFDTLEIKDISLLIYKDPKDEKSHITMWSIENDTLKSVSFDGVNEMKTQLTKNNEITKFNKNYIQSLLPNEEESGWIFTTWEFDSNEHSFIQVYEDVFSKDNNNLESGDYFADFWLEFDAYYRVFPYYTLTTEDVKRVKNGELFDALFELGTPIEEITDTLPNFSQGYFKGAPYYEVPGNRLYYYNETTNKSSVIAISGDSIKNPEAIEDVFGEPTSVFEDLESTPDMKMVLYEFDGYELWFEYDLDNKLTTVELHSEEYK